jgi:hypothetical protein
MLITVASRAAKRGFLKKDQQKRKVASRAERASDI